MFVISFNMLLSFQDAELMVFSLMITALLLIVSQELDENGLESRAKKILRNRLNLFCRP